MKYCIPEVQETPNWGIGAAPEPRVQHAATTRSPGYNTHHFLHTEPKLVQAEKILYPTARPGWSEGNWFYPS